MHGIAHDLGIALGASHMNVMRAVLGRTVLLVVCGLVLGSGLSLWLSPLFAALLYDLHPGDPSTPLAAGLTLAATAALASIAPTLRAVRLDTGEVLRRN